MLDKKKIIRIARKKRVRKKVKGDASRPRLSVSKTNKHIYAQIIDDSCGKTLAFVSTLSKEIKSKLKSKKDVEAAKKVGELIASKAIEKKINNVCFDRGEFPYHGRVKALADSARKAGLKF